MTNLPLEVIFDYACPYCYRAHLFLQEIRTEFPKLQIIFSPCEAHPRPEQWSPHSDLALRGMYYCMERGIDIWAYHDLIYRAFHVDRSDVEKLDILSSCLTEIIDSADLKMAIQHGDYENKRLAANQYAWETLALNAVPSFRMGEQILKAVEDVGVSKRMLLELLSGNIEQLT